MNAEQLGYSVGQLVKAASDDDKKKKKKRKKKFDERVRVMPASGSRRDMPGLFERWTSEAAGEAADPKEEERILQIMSRQNPRALRNTRVYMGYADHPTEYKRSFTNPHSGVLGKALYAIRGLLPMLSDPDDEIKRGPYFSPASNFIASPWNHPAATVHELGHAIDFNWKVPKNRALREIKGLGRDMYMHAPLTTLWKEHAAWRKGTDAYTRGAAKDPKASEADVAKMLKRIGKAKGPALGSYWGAGIGTAAGVAALLATIKSVDDGDMAQETAIPAAYGSALLPFLGILAGTGIGKGTEKGRIARTRRKYLPRFQAERYGGSEDMYRRVIREQELEEKEKERAKKEKERAAAEAAYA